MLGFPILYCKGMRPMMFQLSRFCYTRFPSRPLIIRVPFFLLFGFNKGTQKEKG